MPREWEPQSFRRTFLNVRFRFRRSPAPEFHSIRPGFQLAAFAYGAYPEERSMSLGVGCLGCLGGLSNFMIAPNITH